MVFIIRSKVRWHAGSTMVGSLLQKSSLILSAFVLAVSLGRPGMAQSSARVSLYALDTSSFPEITLGMDVFDASGSPVTDLEPAQVTLLENDISIPLFQLQENQPGVQFAVALDSGKAFAVRDKFAVSRLDVIKDVLRNWVDGHGDAFQDDLGLVFNGGNVSSHLSSSGFVEALAAYQPVLQTLDSSATSLSRALDLVAEPGSQAGMKRVVLYITSPPEAGSIPALQNLVQRAVSLDVRVHVWIVASSDFFSTSGATALKDLSILTGGTYSLFSGLETLPNPEVYLTSLRHSYTLTYASSVRSSGMHTIVVSAVYSDLLLTSDPVVFPLNIQPPNPILVSPPAQIVRRGSDSLSTDYDRYQPASQPIEAIIEFPDGMIRPLTRTALYVDGILVDENTETPFDQFTWDLSSLTRSGDHILQLQAVDNLGLERTSFGVSVSVTVVRPVGGVKNYLARNSLWVVLGAVGTAALALGATLLVGIRKRKLQKGKPSHPDLHPLSAGIGSAPGGGKDRPPRKPASATFKKPVAWLQRLKEDGQPLSPVPIPIQSSEIIFGSDPIHATRVLDDPSVSPLHSRLRFENGRFVLSDENSVAGTWVNYEQLASPHQLRHGDVIHMGRISYRFLLRLPADGDKPRVIPLIRK